MLKGGKGKTMLKVGQEKAGLKQKLGLSIAQ